VSKWPKRTLMAWGWLWLILCALVIWDVLTNGDKRLWREGGYGC